MRDEMVKNQETLLSSKVELLVVAAFESSTL